jgi:phosphate transport system permease protein
MSSDPSRRRRSAHAALAAHGEAWVWLTGGCLALAMAMIIGLLGYIVSEGVATFWPRPLELLELADGRRVLGEQTARDQAPDGGGRRLMRTANFELTGKHFEWFDDAQVKTATTPASATVVERLEGGRFHGFPTRLLHGEEVLAEGADAAWKGFETRHPEVRRRWREAWRIDKQDRGELQRRLRAARLAVVRAELNAGPESPARAAAAAAEEAIAKEVAEAERLLDGRTTELRTANDGLGLEFATGSGESVVLPMAEIVRAWQPNRLSFTDRLGVYVARWGEFLWDDPREANSAGGVFPAIWGTIAMTLIMALLVAPFGVLAALYLREYASRGPVTAAVRIAINNLAGVPSIVYGAFGLGFFCYVVGGSIDELLFRPALVADGQPTFGTGGLLWASLTLALLTLPVVIVSTEEALSAVPNSMREGSYACGASKWQTIRRIVLPRALPGIMTGLILAMARGAGEVAPLMLVGVKKLALDLPIDGTFPFVHPEREFMHLAYLIYDVGFQSPNSQAAKPMVFTITFLLVAIIALLNVAAIWIRGRLRRRYVSQQF